MASALSSFLSSLKSVFPIRNTKSRGNSNSSNIRAAVNTSSSLLSLSASSPARSPDEVATPIPTPTPVPTAISITSEAPSSSNHSVQFYESPRHLIQCMTQLIQTALTVGDAVILIVHDDHRIELEHSVAQLLQKHHHHHQQQQQVWILDVCDTLVQFGAKARTTPKMSKSVDIYNISSSAATTSTTTSSQTGNATDWSCYSTDAMSFSGVMGTLLYGCMSYFTRIHVYDETGSFLLRHNNLDGMTELEQLWNGLQQTFTFSLRCAYPAQHTRTSRTRGQQHHHHHDYTKTGLTPESPNLTLSTTLAESMQPPITTTNMPTSIVRAASQPEPSSTKHTSSISPTPTSSATPFLSPAYSISHLSLTNHNPTSASLDPYQRICECHSYILPQEHQMNNADIELELRHIRFMDRQYQHVFSPEATAKKLSPTTTQPSRNQQQLPQQSPAQSQSRSQAKSQTPKGKFNGSGGISLRTRTRVQAQLPTSSSSGSGSSCDMGVTGTSTISTDAHAQQFIPRRHRQYKKPHIDHLSGLSHTMLRPVTVLPTSPMSPITPSDFSMDPPPQSLIRSSSMPAKLSRSGTVLVVEDNVVNSRIICAMLTRLGLESIVAWNGQECLRKLKEQQQTIHAILMDMQMPIMDGLDATRAIRSLGTEAAHIPIIALTANVSVSDRRACHEAGMDAFLAKPITMQQLAQQLETSLTSPSQASAARRTSQFTQVETEEEAPLFHHDPD